MGRDRDTGARPNGKRAAALVDLIGTRVAVCDGAMGTMLHAAGVSLDVSPPQLNLTRPDLVRAIHGAYLAAGADIIETNTFGASRFRLAHHGLEDRVTELNLAGARIAREAAGVSGRPALVAGSVGPVTPSTAHARLSTAAVRDAFREQIDALVEGGVDLLIFETFGSLDELELAIEEAREAGGGRPLVAQLTFLEDHRTLAGQTPPEVASRLEGAGLAALGANCTLGPQGLLDVILELARHTALPITAQPNAGSPSFSDGRFQYSSDPAYFSRYAKRYAEAGAVIVGGCCGTTPAHIEAVAGSVRGIEPIARPRLRTSSKRLAPSPQPQPEVGQSRMVERLAAREFLVVAELPAPGAAPDQAVHDATLLKAAGCDTVLIAPSSNTRAQVSPVSLAVLLQQRIDGLEAVLSVATWERSVMSVQADLLGAHAFGVRHLLCRTGGPTHVSDYPDPSVIGDVDTVGLIRLLKGMNDGVDNHGIPLAEPTRFVIGARINPTAEELALEIEDARRKIAAGADFLITPPVFEAGSPSRLLEAIGDDIRVPPVLVGVMPLRDYDFAEYLQNEVPDTTVPQEARARLREAGEGARKAGLEMAAALVRELRAGGLAAGVVLYSSTGRAQEIVSLLDAARAREPAGSASR